MLLSLSIIAQAQLLFQACALCKTVVEILRALHAFRLRLNAILEAVTALTTSRRQRKALARRLSV